MSLESIRFIITKRYRVYKKGNSNVLAFKILIVNICFIKKHVAYLWADFEIHHLINESQSVAVMRARARA